MTPAELIAFFKGIYTQHKEEEITFVCIGTDRSTGDALGPLTGSYLLERGFTRVIGTLTDPCDATNLVTYLAGIPQDQVIIAIDACLGSSSEVGAFLCRTASLFPARSVKGQLPPVGDYSIAAIVNANGPKPYSILQMTSLYQVMNMASQIADAAKAELKGVK
ncbi:spore protease YyaC [Paenibacillus sp. Marseille-Q4541]|uniref:spore protease YyaC n=1 Tax=Paenibacillus sp. Marseille-Q4541 TaxID=2831522 RepID=UPI001BA472F4|nr:spore protease YyaC [Paenibacillus sp. Marseille-Q4541]